MKRGLGDLNLLVVFEAVLRDGSVSKAATRLGMSQPALSHALNRLRSMLHDRLFVRTPAGMRPTPRAEALAGPVRHALSGLAAILEPESFTPASAERQFVIAMNNYAAMVLAPAIAARCAALAPGVRLVMRPSGTLDLVSLLDRGELDLALSSPIRRMERLGSTTLLTDGYVAVTRDKHPTGGRLLDLALFASLPFLSISSSPEDMSFIDRELAKAGLSRRIALEAPFLAAAPIILQSDMVALLARNIARSFAQADAIEVRTLPVAGAPIVTSMHWARRFDDHPAHAWLRGVVNDAALCIAGAP